MRLPDKRSIRYCLTTADISKLFGVSEETIRRWFSSQRLPRSGTSSIDVPRLIDMSIYYREHGVLPD